MSTRLRTTPGTCGSSSSAAATNATIAITENAPATAPSTWANPGAGRALRTPSERAGAAPALRSTSPRSWPCPRGLSVPGSGGGRGGVAALGAAERAGHLARLPQVHHGTDDEPDRAGEADEDPDLAVLADAAAGEVDAARARTGDELDQDEPEDDDRGDAMIWFQVMLPTLGRSVPAALRTTSTTSATPMITAISGRVNPTRSSTPTRSRRTRRRS